MVFEEILQIVAFGGLIVLLQYLNKTGLKDALKEVIAFYMNKDREEKSIVYSIISLMNKGFGIEPESLTPPKPPSPNKEILIAIKEMKEEVMTELSDLKQRVTALENRPKVL